jgi:hypothetical protein
VVTRHAMTCNKEYKLLSIVIIVERFINKSASISSLSFHPKRACNVEENLIKKD